MTKRFRQTFEAITALRRIGDQLMLLRDEEAVVTLPLGERSLLWVGGVGPKAPSGAKELLWRINLSQPSAVTLEMDRDKVAVAVHAMRPWLAESS